MAFSANLGFLFTDLPLIEAVRAAKAAATKVDFFTLVRGED